MGASGVSRPVSGSLMLAGGVGTLLPALDPLPVLDPVRFAPPLGSPLLTGL